MKMKNLDNCIFYIGKTNFQRKTEVVKWDVPRTLHENPKFKSLENEAVSAINVFTGINIPVEKKGGKTDMCKAWKDHKNAGKAEGKIEGKNLINQLNACLIKDGRLADLEESIKNPEYQENLIAYYGLDKQEETV